MNVAVIDLGCGNIRSLRSALNFLGVSHQIVTDSVDIVSATHLVLPGVGAFDTAMAAMNRLGLYEPVRMAALSRRLPTLGVCLGMQLLFERSEEGDLPGLGLIEGESTRLTTNAESPYKVPHVGFASVSGYNESGLFAGLGPTAQFYFTHSYAVSFTKDANVAMCDHARPFVAAFQIENICGAQFHPEKSQSTGLHLLSNFFANS